MAASLDTIAMHLERIERALTEQTAQPVRSLSVDAVVRPADLDDWLAHLASRS